MALRLRRLPGQLVLAHDSVAVVVRVTESDGSFSLEVHVAVVWGARAPEIGLAVQGRVADYLRRTAKLPSVAVDVVVAAVA